MSCCSQGLGNEGKSSSPRCLRLGRRRLGCLTVAGLLCSAKSTRRRYRDPRLAVADVFSTHIGASQQCTGDGRFRKYATWTPATLPRRKRQPYPLGRHPKTYRLLASKMTSFARRRPAMLPSTSWPTQYLHHLRWRLRNETLRELTPLADQYPLRRWVR